MSNLKSIKRETLSDRIRMSEKSACGSFQVRTCARHLERVRVGAIVPVPADAVHGALAGGAAVDGTLHAGLPSLSWLEEAGWAG